MGNLICSLNFDMMCQKHLEGLVVPDPSMPRASYSVDTEAGSAEVVFPPPSWAEVRPRKRRVRAVRRFTMVWGLCCFVCRYLWQVVAMQKCEAEIWGAK